MELIEIVRLSKQEPAIFFLWENKLGQKVEAGARIGERSEPELDLDLVRGFSSRGQNLKVGAGGWVCLYSPGSHSEIHNSFKTFSKMDSSFFLFSEFKHIKIYVYFLKLFIKKKPEPFLIYL